ncbi:MAG: radical SAM protein [Deltaproteobacteria bacterium HGW-Deltaproteobacteria-9]|nr:MAG: radical SAM protein [Deltaproteobacteria bacterium HGW-Deltaproteobacteria-9]
MVAAYHNDTFKESARIISELSFDIGVYRPPSEGGSASLLLRVTENCPWNKCAFCDMYKDHPFVYRSVEDIKKDINTVRKISDEIKAVSEKIGQGGQITRDVGMAILRADPTLNNNQCFISVFNWLYSGGKTAFLQDADSMIMRPQELVSVLKHLRKKLQSLIRVTSYARSKTLSHRKPEDLRAIREAGLDRLHVGLETGDDELLTMIRKGVTGAQQIEGGKRAMAAGFQLSEYWMTDLGGRERWQQHAENTARVLTEINPNYIRSRPFVPRGGTPIFAEYEQGRLHLSSPHERLEELRLMMERLNVTSRVCFDHQMNSWVNRQGGLLFSQDYEGYKFPEQKPLVLELIREGLSIDESRHIDVKDLISMNSL